MFIKMVVLVGSLTLLIRQGTGQSETAPPMPYEDQPFESQDIHAANSTYRRCKFHNCTIIFENGAFEFDKCKFSGCTWKIAFDASFDNPEAGDFQNLSHISDVIVNAEFQKPTFQISQPPRQRQVLVAVRYKRNLWFEIQRRVVGTSDWELLTPDPTQLPLAPPQDTYGGFRTFTDSAAVQPQTKYEYEVCGFDADKDGDSTGWSDPQPITVMY
jgi:hypothetical protein